MRQLPYVFDLLHDIKDTDQVDQIIAREASFSSATPMELYMLFWSNKIELTPLMTEQLGTLISETEEKLIKLKSLQGNKDE